MILTIQVHPTQYRTEQCHFLLYLYPGCPPCLDSHGIQTSTQTTFLASIYLIAMQAALLMHNTLWLAEGILDMPWPPGHALAPLTCPAPSQHATTIPDVSHMPFMCPSPSHDLTHTPQPPSMFNAPHPFSTCHCHPRCVLHALHMPQPQP